MPGSDGPENLKILKKGQLGVDFGPCRQTVGFSAIEVDSMKLSSDHGVEKLRADYGVEKLRLVHEMCRALGRCLPSMIRKTFKNCVSLLVSKNRTQKLSGCPCGVMVKAMDCGIVVSEFVLQSRYYVHFRANTLGKGMNPLILPAMG